MAKRVLAIPVNMGDFQAMIAEAVNDAYLDRKPIYDQESNIDLSTDKIMLQFVQPSKLQEMIYKSVAAALKSNKKPK